MPMDIRAYFSKTPDSKSSTTKPAENSSTKSKRSRKRVFIDSDSDDDSTKNVIANGTSSSKKSKSEINEKSKYFEVSKTEVANIFGKGPIKRVEQPKLKKNDKVGGEFIEDIDWDDDFTIIEDSTPAQKSESSKSPEKTNKKISIKLSSDVQSPEIYGIKDHKQDLFSEKLSIKEKVSPKKSEHKEQEKPLQNVNKDHEMSPSPEREINHSRSPPERNTVSRKISPPKRQEKVYANGLLKQNSPKKSDLKSPSSSKNKESIHKKIKLAEEKETNLPESFPKKPLISPRKSQIDATCQLWVDKYKPSNLKQIIGQQGEKSNVNKLVKWLKNWFSNHSGKKKLPKPSYWAKDDNGTSFKAALLSGPPGVGKTTTAHLVCKELGMDAVEFNASDTRSKRLLKEEISDLLKSKSLSGYITGGESVSKHHVLVMDEVDGMAGNEDRGGVQELIQLIKTSRVPIICMCNDRNHPKIRSLANYCFDLRFSKPRAEQIKGAMLSVCFKEGLKINPDVLNDIIVNTNQDIRLILNNLSILAAQNAMNMPVASKYVKIGPWDVVRKVFSEQDHKKMSLYDKCDLFFYDYNIAPLFVQENYLYVQPHSDKSKSKRGKMELFAKASESIAYGDIIEKTIRSSNAWGLLPVQAVFSSYIPGEYLVGHMGGQINFPAWLGKNSRRGKIDRMCQEIQAHTRLKVSGSKEAINLDYSSVLKERIVRPLVDRGADGVEESISLLREYSLLREDLDSLSEITTWPNSHDLFSKLESKVKSAFTRAYNKNPVATPFSIIGPVKKSRAGATSDELDVGDENLEDAEGDDDEENQDDITMDGMIVIKKKTSKEDNKKAESTAAGSSKRGGGGGRGKRGKK